MTFREDSASSVQDTETIQKAVEEEQGNWCAEWKAYINKPNSSHTSCPPLSEPSIVSFVKDMEIVRLKERIASLECTQSAYQDERNEWQAKYQREHEEALRLASANTKQDRMINSLEGESSDLLEEIKTRDKKLSTIPHYVARTTPKREKNRYLDSVDVE